MLPYENILKDNLILNENSPTSSDTETPLEEIKHSKSHINEQWEAIERTLYQENGQQVTDSDLLKECKLWRDTFPHLRIKGNQLNVKSTQNFKDSSRNVETLTPSTSLTKLNEKRENIKKTVVDGLVQRLITKFNVNKLTTENASIDNLKNPGKVAESCDNCSEGIFKKFNNSTGDKINENALEICDKNKEWKNNLSTPKTESYFERGKLFESIDEIEKEFKRDTIEEKYYKMFDILEKELKEKNSLNKCGTKNSVKQKNFKKEKLEIKSIKPPEGEVIGIDLSEKPYISHRKSPLPDSLTNYIKPVEIKTKINKKYEGLLNKIINKKTAELDSTKHCQIYSSGNKPKSISEFSENIRFESAPKEDNITLPKIHKFNNTWLNRTANAYHNGEGHLKKSQEKFKKNLTPYFRELTPNDIDEKFMNNFKKEMLTKYRRTSVRFEGTENFKSRKPRIYTHNCEHTHKSLSCGDLPKKNNKYCQKRQVNSILGNDIINSNLKPRSKSTNLNKSKPMKIVGNKNGVLPPIESGIIITELTGRPKIGSKTLSKKR